MRDKENREIGREEGREEQLIEQIRKKIDKGKSIEVIADELEEPVEEIGRIMDKLNKDAKANQMIIR